VDLKAAGASTAPLEILRTKLTLNIIQKAEEAYLNGKTEEALNLLGAVIAKEPDNLRALANLGVIFLAQGVYQEAQSAWEKVLSLNPERLEARQNLILSLMGQKNYLGAKALLEGWLAQNQEDFVLWKLIGKVEFALDNWRVALSYANRSLLLNPEQADLQAWVSSFDPAAADSGRKESPPRDYPREMAIFVGPRDNAGEIDLLLEGLSAQFRVRKVVSLNKKTYEDALDACDFIWLEGFKDLGAYFIRENKGLAGRETLLRLTREDIIAGGAAKKMSFEPVRHIVFESVFLRNYFLLDKPIIRPGTGLYAIPRALDLKTCQFRKREGKKKIASIIPELWTSGEFILLLEAFLSLRDCHPELELHLSVGQRDMNREVYVSHFISENGLGDAVFYHFNANLGGFLAENDLILAADVFAGTHGVMEALTMGLAPLVRSSPGAKELVPENCLWSNFKELLSLYDNSPDPEELSQSVLQKYSPEAILSLYLKIFNPES
jgi:tetratricopeptide (TPR) repeat protein